MAYSKYVRHDSFSNFPETMSGELMGYLIRRIPLLAEEDAERSGFGIGGFNGEITD